MFKPKLKFPQEFPLLKKKITARIGLDLGSSSLKIVVLEPKENNYVLKQARVTELSSKSVDINSLIKDLDVSPGVNLGICGPSIAVRYVIVTKMNDDEFKRSLRYEAASHLPFRLEELYLDGAILKQLPENKMLVMFAAAKKEFVDLKLRLFQESNIKLNLLDIDSLALINAFNYVQAGNDIFSGGAIVLLNIGASITSINILEDGIPHFSRDIDIGGKDISKGTSRDVVVANLVSEIRKSLDYYEAGSAAIINKIFLSGGASLISNLANDLGNFLGIPIQHWDPLSNFEFESGLDEASIRKSSVLFGVAVGLALREK